jgi:hypothetical protein
MKWPERGEASCRAWTTPPGAPAGIRPPLPIFVVLAMRLGQLFGTLSLATSLLAIVLDLQSGSRAGTDREGEGDGETHGSRVARGRK